MIEWQNFETEVPLLNTLTLFFICDKDREVNHVIYLGFFHVDIKTWNIYFEDFFKNKRIKLPDSAKYFVQFPPYVMPEHTCVMDLEES